MSKNYHIVSYGCQMNVHESEKIAGILRRMDYEETDTLENADIIVFNTCCIRENAENHAFGNIGALKKLKKQKPQIIIAVGGCMTQEKGKAEVLKKKFPFIDIMFGTLNMEELGDLIKRKKSQKKKVIEIREKEGEIVEFTDAYRTSYPNAWVNIMYGCNNFCSYCIVPYVRGRERSRNPENIVAEVEKLVAEGYREITLLGQNVNSYGKDLPEKTSISELLHEISKIEGDFWLHLMTSHPKDASSEMIEAIKDSPRTSGHFHLPLQSGSDEILTKMNRHYDLEKYLGIINKLRKDNENITLTTDIIVGFPGESDEDFEKTLDVIKKVRYDSVFSFIYSPRKGTPAASMENQIPEEIKHTRYDEFCRVQNDISKEINESLIGKTVRVLVDGKSKSNEQVYTSRTQGNKIVHFECDKDLTGNFINVKITRADTFNLFGEII